MIVLNSVSKDLGKGRLKKRVLDDINWTIPPRHNFVILGQRGSGKSTLLDLVAGLAIPTEGWVDRRARVSVPGGLLKFATFDTPRKLIMRMSELYEADPLSIIEFAIQATQMQEIIDVPIRRFPGWVRTQLNMALTYAFPCDYYLFDGAIDAGRKSEFRDFCRRAFEMRSKSAATIVVTGSARTARTIGNNAMGGLLHRGKLTLYEQVEDAITVFESLPKPPEPSVLSLLVPEPEGPVVEDEL